MASSGSSGSGRKSVRFNRNDLYFTESIDECTKDDVAEELYSDEEQEEPRDDFGNLIVSDDEETQPPEESQPEPESSHSQRTLTSDIFKIQYSKITLPNGNLQVVCCHVSILITRSET